MPQSILNHSNLNQMQDQHIKRKHADYNIIKSTSDFQKTLDFSFDYPKHKSCT